MSKKIEVKYNVAPGDYVRVVDADQFEGDDDFPPVGTLGVITGLGLMFASVFFGEQYFRDDFGAGSYPFDALEIVDFDEDED